MAERCLGCFIETVDFVFLGSHCRMLRSAKHVESAPSPETLGPTSRSVPGELIRVPAPWADDCIQPDLAELWLWLKPPMSIYGSPTSPPTDEQQKSA